LLPPVTIALLPSSRTSMTRLLLWGLPSAPTLP
jgi:hypothetical protein